MRTNDRHELAPPRAGNSSTGPGGGGGSAMTQTPSPQPPTAQESLHTRPFLTGALRGISPEDPPPRQGKGAMPGTPEGSEARRSPHKVRGCARLPMSWGVPLPCREKGETGDYFTVGNLGGLLSPPYLKSLALLPPSTPILGCHSTEGAWEVSSGHPTTDEGPRVPPGGASNWGNEVHPMVHPWGAVWGHPSSRQAHRVLPRGFPNQEWGKGVRPGGPNTQLTTLPPGPSPGSPPKSPQPPSPAVGAGEPP